MIPWLKNLLAGCILIVPALFLGVFADELNPEDLAKSWTIQQENTATEEASFTLNADQSFIISGPGEEAQAGTWSLKGDSLFLAFELIPVNTGIDSISYSASENQPLLRLFKEGKEVARQTESGLTSPRRMESYQVVLEKGSLKLSGNNRSYDLFFKTITEPEFAIMDLFRGLLGIVGLLFFAWLFSVNRKAINWSLVGKGMGLQLILAILVLKVPGFKTVFEWIAGFFVKILEFTQAGAGFLFDGLVLDVNSFGYIFAFQILPTIVFFSALMSILYYLGVLQKVVYGFAWLMKRTMGLSGAESLAAAGNIFMGQTEAPLLIRPYLEGMTRSEIMALMTGGMATIAGGVFAAYIGYLGGTDPVAQQIFATHLLTASIMSAPAALVAAKMLVPETEQFNEELEVPKDRIGSNILDAISNGTSDGLKLAVNVGVMLLVFISMIEMLNYFIGDLLGEFTGLNAKVLAATDGRYDQFNLEYIFGLLFAPIAWLLGVPADDMVIIGQMLGEKTIINEFVAYTTLGDAKAAGLVTNFKSIIIATYALCGFANFASIGIQIGGIGALAPGQRKTLASLGFRALIGGTIAAFLTAAMAGMLYAI